MLKVSESYVIGIDISDRDEAMLTVAKNTGFEYIHINTIFGDEAINLYEKIINNKLSLERMSK